MPPWRLNWLFCWLNPSFSFLIDFLFSSYPLGHFYSMFSRWTEACLLPVSPTSTSPEIPTWIYLQICPKSTHFPPSALLWPGPSLAPGPCGSLLNTPLPLLPSNCSPPSSQTDPVKTMSDLCSPLLNTCSRSSLHSECEPYCGLRALCDLSLLPLLPTPFCSSHWPSCVLWTGQAPYLKIWAPAAPSAQTSTWLTPSPPSSHFKLHLWGKDTLMLHLNLQMSSRGNLHTLPLFLL